MNWLIAITCTVLPLVLLGLLFHALARAASRADEWDEAMRHIVNKDHDHPEQPDQQEQQP